MNAEEVVIIIQFVAFFGLYLPFFIYILYNFIKLIVNADKEKNAFSRRIPSLVLFQIIVQFIAVFRHSLLNQSSSCILSDCGYDTISQEIHQSIRIITSVNIIFVVLFRTFFVVYGVKYNFIVSNSEWWQHINSEFNKNNNFWIKYKNTIGSWKYMWKYIVLFLIALESFNIVIVYIDLRASAIFQTFWI